MFEYVKLVPFIGTLQHLKPGAVLQKCPDCQTTIKNVNITVRSHSVASRPIVIICFWKSKQIYGLQCANVDELPGKIKFDVNINTTK
jgi:hypothetical protein